MTYVGQYRGFRVYAEGSTLHFERCGNLHDPVPGQAEAFAALAEQPLHERSYGRSPMEDVMERRCQRRLRGDYVEGVWFDESGPVPEEIFQRALHPSHLARIRNFMQELVFFGTAVNPDCIANILRDTPPRLGTADRVVPKPDDGEDAEPPMAPLAKWLASDHGIEGMK